MALTLAVAAGCGDSTPAAPIARADLATCDITTNACQRSVYNSVAAMLEAEEYPMPNIRTISVEQHADEVRSGFDLDDLSGEDAVSRGLRLLGFIPQASDSLGATQLEFAINNIAAYYQRGNRRVTIIDRDYEQGSAQVILAHEFVHAIQDSQFGLTNIGSGVDTEDGVIGVRSVVEGDAVFSSFQWYYETTNVDLSTVDWEQIFDDSTGRLLDLAVEPEVPLIDTASSFPYSYGFELMARASFDKGLAARGEAFGAPPQSTAEVMVGYGGAAPTLDLPASAHPAPLAPLADEPGVRNRYGAWYVYGFLRRAGIEHEQAWAAALGWVGDELAIYDDGTDVIVVWRVRFDEAMDAGLLTDQVNAEGADGGRSAVLFGDDAYVFAAETTETLLAWVDQPLDEMAAAIVPKGLPEMGGAVSVGTCMLLHDFWATDPHALLR